MYVSYLLEKDASSMYNSSVRQQHASLNLNHQSFVPQPPPPQYADFPGYHHHVPGISGDPHHGQAQGAWTPAYNPAARDDSSWSHYGPPGGGTGASTSNPPGTIGFSPPEFSPVQPPPGLLPSINPAGGQLSPNSQRRNPYDWMRRSVPPTTAGGKTRTKDKYRVVYTDHQRLELEKEFHYSRYITIRRKAELATSLCLSERQVKIWFQNRRAKERKVNKKKMQQPASSTAATPPGNGLPGNAAMVTSSTMASPSIQMNIKEEY